MRHGLNGQRFIEGVIVTVSQQNGGVPIGTGLKEPRAIDVVLIAFIGAVLEDMKPFMQNGDWVFFGLKRQGHVAQIQVVFADAVSPVFFGKAVLSGLIIMDVDVEVAAICHVWWILHVIFSAEMVTHLG